MAVAFLPHSCFVRAATARLVDVGMRYQGAVDTMLNIDTFLNFRTSIPATSFRVHFPAVK
jgi:hypothetical protein